MWVYFFYLYHPCLISPKAEDILVHQDKEHREWMYGVDFTEDGKYVTLYIYKDSARVSSSSFK